MASLSRGACTRTEIKRCAKQQAATPGHESAKKLGKELNPATAEAEAQGTPDVVTKRRILRAKLAEADSPLASPKAVV